MFLLLFALFFASFGASDARAAACCGGSSAMPSLVTTDDRAAWTAELSRSAIIGDAPAHGVPVFRSGNDSEYIHSLTLSHARLISDRWQVGASLPLQFRTRSVGNTSASHWGVADLLLSLGYEVLPEWEYSAWRPHGFTFIALTVPTGRSVYDLSTTSTSSASQLGVETHGKGFWSLSVGGLLTKSFGNWDGLFSMSVSKPLDRTVSVSDGTTYELKPTWGFASTLGVGRSFGDFRVGVSLGPTYEGRLKTLGTTSDVSSEKLSWNAALSAAYMPSSTESWVLTYTDQTLVGPAKNTTLARTLALSFQYRLPR